MMPFFFGSSSRPLYGVLDAARGGGRAGVVICQPAGDEYFHAHRSCRLLARRLGDAGVHALRFDPSGTGDSGGELDEVSWEDWVRDVELAIEELRATAGVHTVMLVGLRAGCVAALAAGLRDPDVDGLVLWDPLGLDDVATGAPHGVPTCGEAVLEARGEDAREMLLLLTREAAESSSAMGALLREQGHDVEVATFEEAGAWEAGEGVGSVPIPARSIQEIVRWLEGRR
jgi:pimeloyl-ACP methyl ester carboxylesterase